MTYVIQWKRNRQGRWLQFPDVKPFDDIEEAIEQLDEAREIFPASIFRIRKRQPKKETANA